MHDDGRGNVAALTEANTTQTVRAFYALDGFGAKNNARVLDSYTQQDQPFQFATKWRHGNSGLVYFGARWYDPNLGRFITRDPIGEVGGLNLHGFVGNDPINNVDPWGLQR